MRLRLGFALLACLFAADRVSADALPKSAVPGQPSLIDSYSGWNDDCSFLEISLELVKEPSHGRVSTRIGQRTITNAAIGAAGGCKGKPTPVLQIWFTPDNNYHGTDRIGVDMSIVKGGVVGIPAHFDYAINVE